MIIYINGYWNRFTGLFGLSPATPEESYWNYFSPHFITSSCDFIKVNANESKSFIDGSSLFGIDQLAGERFLKGSKYAIDHYTKLRAQLKHGESFKIISHSEGGAFAAGMADILISYGSHVETILYLSPREGDAFISPLGAFSVQVHFSNDPICFPRQITGVSVFINLLKIDGKKPGLRYAHGSTVKESTLLKVKDILKKLPFDHNKQTIEGHWVISETEWGYDFERVADLIF